MIKTAGKYNITIFPRFEKNFSILYMCTLFKGVHSRYKPILALTWKTELIEYHTQLIEKFTLKTDKKNKQTADFQAQLIEKFTLTQLMRKLTH